MGRRRVKNTWWSLYFCFKELKSWGGSEDFFLLFRFNSKVQIWRKKITRQQVTSTTPFSIFTRQSSFSGMWFYNRKKILKKWVASLGLPLVLRTKPPWTSWMFNFGRCTDSHSPHPHKQETRGLDTIQVTSFFPWWLLLSFLGGYFSSFLGGYFSSFLGGYFSSFKRMWRQREICKNPEIRKKLEKSQAWFFTENFDMKWDTWEWLYLPFKGKVED